MKRRNATRNALFTSIMSLLLCVSMLVGTTFAWFTDTVVSGNNVIAAGNLDIELEYYDGSDWKTVNGATELFTGNLWEPGHTEVVYLKLSNLGTLALKYHLGINISSETEGTNVAGKTFKLSDHIYMGVVENAEPTYTSREAAITAAKGGANGIIGAGYTKSGSMVGKTGSDEVTQYLALVVYMPTTVGNEANYMTGTAVPTINLGINLFATQVENENDSFGNDYDKGSAWTGEVTEVPAEVNGVITITSAGELAAFAAAVNNGNAYTGKTIKLGANIDLNDIAWTPIGTTSNPFNGNFYGEGYTISNLVVQGSKWLGLFGYVKNAAHIEGVTIDGAIVFGNDYVGAVLGGGYLAQNCVKNCTVKNAKIVAEPYLLADGVTYDGGAKAGAVVGYAINGNISGNSAIGCEVTAYRDLGAIAGMVSGENRAVAVSGNNVDNVALTYRDLNGAAYESSKVNENMGNIVGRTQNVTNSETIDNDNTVGTVTRATEIKWAENGIEYTKDVDTGIVTLYLVPTDYEGTTVNVLEGVDTIGGYAFAYNSNIETIVLPSSVTTLNDRAFRDTSASTVVLNEGLTNISYQAFRNASNVKEVAIPSTVTTISKEAFQNSGITTLTIPANVTTLEYGACRDMKNLETVVIEGNVDIPVYAFRACTNLKTVIITGEEVTFGGGSKGMIFTNKENGDGSAITVYVANETVKERLVAADTAASSYGGYEIVVATIPDSNTTAAEKADAVSDALADGGNVILTDDLTFSTNDTTANSGYGKTGVTVAEGSVLDGNGNTLTVTDANGTWDCAVQAKNGTIQNLTVNGAFRGIFMGSATGDVYIDDVVIDKVCYTFNSDGGNKEYGVYISNSTLNGWTSYSNVHKEVVFTDCKFGADTGSYKYAFCRPYNASVFENCVFEEGFEFDTSKTSDIVFKNCYYGDTLITAENAATLGNGDTTFFYNGLNGITINGAQVVESAEDLSAALAAGGDVVLTEDVSTEATTTAPYGNKVGFVHNGGEFDGNGNTVGITNSGDNYAVMTSGGTIKNLTVNDGFRGIMIMNPTVDIVLDNVYAGGDVCYALNTGEGDGTHSLIAINSTFKGWTSFGTAIKDASFTNCTFGQGDYYTDVFGRLVKPYVDTVFENCEFNSKFYIDLSQLGKDGDGNVLKADAKIVLKNCTVNGVKLTADNWTQLIAAESDCGEGQISIEAKDGSYMTAANILDYVIIQ